MNLRSKGAIIGFYHLHLLLAVAVSILTFIIEFAFARRIQSDYFWTEYNLNIFSLTIGAGLYMISYYFIWDRLLGVDWSQMKANKAGAGWYVWLSFISLGAILNYFIISIIILVIWYDFPTFSPIDSWAILLLTIAYSILFPVFRIIASKIKNKEK